MNTSILLIALAAVLDFAVGACVHFADEGSTFDGDLGTIVQDPDDCAGAKPAFG
jgi:hypothetical protein